MNAVVFGIIELVLIVSIVSLALLQLFSHVQKRSVRWKSGIMLLAAVVCFALGHSLIEEVFRPADRVTISFSESDARVLKYYTSTAPALTDGLTRITTSPDLPFLVRLGDNQSVGLYSAIERSIQIMDGTGTHRGIDSHLWSHEVAHHIWYMKLTDEERSNWTQHYDIEKIAYASNKTGFFLTEYSLTKVEEDYADAFALFVDPIHSTDGSWREAQLNSHFLLLLGCRTPLESAFVCFYNSSITSPLSRIQPSLLPG